ncbi:hydroxyethylthiazole kinase [Microbacterium suaedae]|uniref:hydroxyethylthiazole kinase n=1 Tax=Microbacterium suaedae TaxID=2067813 RepID=UPI000DA14FD2|nr:hydroxyethylthiazole kinase [Microbacterium suaedae]
MSDVVVPGVRQAEVLSALREGAPLVQCLTNVVVTNFTANALLAVGAAPVMVDVPEEAVELAPGASSVLINLGTPHEAQRQAMLGAAQAAERAGTPWILDPVGVGALTLRTEFARELLAHRPSVIRGNASEIRALAGQGAGGRGVDAIDAVESALPAAEALVGETGAIVAVSGPVDVVVDGASTTRVSGGSALLTRVTGGGCSLGAVIAAAVSAASDSGSDAALAGTVMAHALYAEASERAARAAAGPGSFAVAFLDELATVAPGDLARAERTTR